MWVIDMLVTKVIGDLGEIKNIVFEHILQSKCHENINILIGILKNWITHNSNKYFTKKMQHNFDCLLNINFIKRVCLLF